MRIESECMNLQLIHEDEAVEGCANGSDALRSRQEMEEEQDICKFPENSLNIPVSEKKLSKSVNKRQGFNLRKSLAWNPAFFSEEGVLDPLELSYINGSVGKSNGSHRPGKRPVLNEVIENSCEKSYQNPELRVQTGRRLFCTPESSKRSSRNQNSSETINKRIPRPLITNSQKRVANTTVFGHVPKVPKFMPGNTTPNSKNAPKAVKLEQLNIKKTIPLPPKSSNHHQTRSKITSNENVAPTSTKPSGLRMPSPSYNFFSQGKVSVQCSNSSQKNIENTLIINSKPPIHKHVDNSRLSMIPPSPSTAKCRPPIGRIRAQVTKPNTVSTNQIGSKSTMSKTQKSDKLVLKTSKREKESPIRVLKSKEGPCSSDSGSAIIRGCEEESKDDSTKIELDTTLKTLTTSNEEETFTNRIISCQLDSSESCSSREKRKSKRKSSVYGVSPLKNKREKIVFSPNKRKSLEEEKLETKSSAEKNKKENCFPNFRKDLVPFSDEWLAALEAFGEEILEKKTGPVQHSPPDKTIPEPSPWSPVKRKVQDIGPYDCTKYSKPESSDAQ